MESELEQVLPGTVGARTPFGKSLLLYMVIVTVLMTLAPFRFSWPSHPRVVWSGDLHDLICNVLLFMPLGFLLELSISGSMSRWHLRALLFGFLLSSAIEGLQLFLPGRVTSFSDVVTNSLGAWVGAFLHEKAERNVRGRLLGKLTLELPLSILFYLVGALLWVNALAARDESARLWLGTLLGVIGAIILAALWIHRVGPVANIPRGSVHLAVGGWFLLGSLPAVVEDPSIVFISMLFAVGVAELLVRYPSILGAAPGKRFEIPTLIRIAPLYLLFLGLLTYWPLQHMGSIGYWEGELGLNELMDIPGEVPVLQLMEYITAYSILGYMVAQARGRRAESTPRSLLVVLVVSLCVGGGLELLRGYHPHHHASLVRLILLCGSGVFGGFIYRSQLETVREILRTQKPREQPKPKAPPPVIRGGLRRRAVPPPLTDLPPKL
ncbi:MAG: VanZ family protein [Planctomycetota bacterium]